MTKYIANAFFYRLRFRTIDWLTKKIVGGQPLIWWLVFDIVGYWLLILLAGQNIIANIRIWALCFMKAVGNYLSFPTKKKSELIWISRTQDMSWKPNSVWAAEQVSTSPLLLRFELENDKIESWTLMIVLGLCLSFPSIKSRPKSEFYNSSYDPITEWCSSLELNQHLFS